MGRMQRTPEQRERILDEYERSGLSGPKFAAVCGVKYQTFAAWLGAPARANARLIQSGSLTASPTKSHGLRLCANRSRPPTQVCCYSCPVAGSAGQYARPKLRWPPHVACSAKAMLTFSGSLKIFVAVEPCDNAQGL